MFLLSWLNLGKYQLQKNQSACKETKIYNFLWNTRLLLQKKKFKRTEKQPYSLSKTIKL